MKIRYVLIVAMDMSTGFVVGITKKKGPSFLLNKLTFPGGKVEDGETVLEAAKRELGEEVGIDAPLEDFQVVSVEGDENYELTTVLVLTDKVLTARQLEQEPVWHLAYQRHLEYSEQRPEHYAPDFRQKLCAALLLVVMGVRLPEPA